jgi:hypothetical protein
MLHLPSLNNVVADFLSPPPPLESSITVATVAAAHQVDFEAMATEQNRSAETQHCLAVHPSNLLSDKQALNAWLAMFPRKFFIPLSRQNSKKTFSCIFTASPTLRGWPLGALCLLGLPGVASPTM